MRDFLKRMKADYMLSSVLCIILGIVIVIYRAGVINLIGQILAVIMIVIGAVYLLGFLMGLSGNGFSVVAGILILAAGIWVMSQPAIVMSLVPVIIGVLLLFHGIRAVMETVSAKKFGYEAWGINLLLAIICTLCGLICVFDAFSIVENAMVFVGIILIFNGASNIWIAFAAARAARDYERRTGTVDVQFVEDEKNEADGI